MGFVFPIAPPNAIYLIGDQWRFAPVAGQDPSGAVIGPGAVVMAPVIVPSASRILMVQGRNTTPMVGTEVVTLQVLAEGLPVGLPMILDFNHDRVAQPLSIDVPAGGLIAVLGTGAGPLVVLHVVFVSLTIEEL